MGLEQEVKLLKAGGEILLMTHQILGYPSFPINERAIELFLQNGIHLVELQIPFSEPVADGPTFLSANQAAVKSGVKVADCLDFVKRMAEKHRIHFLIMTYYNIIFKYGVERFVEKCKEIGVKGLIVPDAPIDDATEFYEACRKAQVDAIGLTTAFTSEKRAKEIAHLSSGFIYHVPRKGVTGSKTFFEEEVLEKIKWMKEVSGKNIAVGFGIQDRFDIEKLQGVADIAVIGSKVLKVIEQEGIEKLDEFLKELRLKAKD